MVPGAPVLEVQEPTVATTAAAFDEGGNFIDVRFGPLTRGANGHGSRQLRRCRCAGRALVRLRQHRPVSLGGNLATGNPLVGCSGRSWRPIGAAAIARSNWIRGAIATTAP